MIKHTYVNASDDPGAYAADQCNRQAVTAQFAWDNLCDKPIWLYSQEAADMGLDPWTLCNGMDREIPSGMLILEYGRTGERRLKPEDRVYAQRSTLKELGLPEGSAPTKPWAV